VYFCLEREDCGGDMADMAGVWVCILYVNIIISCESVKWKCRKSFVFLIDL
jgi:hypothetical protein